MCKNNLKSEPVPIQVMAHPLFKQWNQYITGFTPKDHQKFGGHHGLVHWIRVTQTALAFVKAYGITSERALMLTEVAALLHDCGLIFGDDNHANTGASLAKLFLESSFSDELCPAEIDLICHAIKCHSGREEIVNIYDAAVLFADKTHVDKSRVIVISDAIYAQEALINKVDFEITDDALYLRYDTDEGFDLRGFAEWKGAYEGPAKVADWMDKKFVFVVNGKEVDIAKIHNDD
ncbi:MAG: HD domain-containing protein [Candidatus Saccharibacteria bacterium]|nr:HD domain-containing protein [Candidatus Saccharibacteria bacterium]